MFCVSERLLGPLESTRPFSTTLSTYIVVVVVVCRVTELMTIRATIIDNTCQCYGNILFMTRMAGI
jgi:hypothetical protein